MDSVAHGYATPEPFVPDSAYLSTDSEAPDHHDSALLKKHPIARLRREAHCDGFTQHKQHVAAMPKTRLSWGFRDILGPAKSIEKDHYDYDNPYDWSPPPSPSPGRRPPLTSMMEADLKLACAGVVMNTIPSDFMDESTAKPRAALVERPVEVAPTRTAVRENARVEGAPPGPDTMAEEAEAGSSSPVMDLGDLPAFPIPSRHSTFLKKAGIETLLLQASKGNAAVRTSLGKRKANRMSTSKPIDTETANGRADTTQTQTSGQRSRSRPLSTILYTLPAVYSSLRPKTFRRTVSDHRPASAEGHQQSGTRPLSGAADKRAKHASYHGSTTLNFDFEAYTQGLETGRAPWYKFFFSDGKIKSFEAQEHASAKRRSAMIHAHREKTLRNVNHEADDRTHTVSDKRRSLRMAISGVIKDAAAVTTLARLAGQVDAPRKALLVQTNLSLATGVGIQPQLSGTPLDRPLSSGSSRSSASSGVIPIHYHRLSWKHMRKSWSSWRDGTEDERQAKRKSREKRLSTSSARNRMSQRFSRDIQQLPMIYQTQSEETHALDETEGNALSRPLSTSIVASFPTPAAEKTQKPVQTENITVPRPSTAGDILMPLTAHPVRGSSDGATTENYRLSVPTFDGSDQMITIAASPALIRPSTSPAAVSRATSRTRHIPKAIQIAPVPKRLSMIQIATPDGRSKTPDQRKSIDLVEAVRLAKSVDLKEKLASQQRSPLLEHKRSPTKMHRHGDARKSIDFKKSIEFWKSLEQNQQPELPRVPDLLYRSPQGSSRPSTRSRPTTRAGHTSWTYLDQPSTPNLVGEVTEAVSEDDALLSLRSDSTGKTLSETSLDDPIETIHLSTAQVVLVQIPERITETVTTVKPPGEAEVPTGELDPTDAAEAEPSSEAETPLALPSPPSDTATPTDSVLGKETAKDPGSPESKASVISEAVRAESTDTVEALASPTSVTSARTQRPLSWLPTPTDVPEFKKLADPNKARSAAASQDNGRSKSITSSSAQSASRDDSVDQYNSLKHTRYLCADDIHNLASLPIFAQDLQTKRKRFPWRGQRKKQLTWMDEMEALGVKDGILLMDQLNGPPIVRY